MQGVFKGGPVVKRYVVFTGLVLLLLAGCAGLNPVATLIGVTPEEARMKELMQWHSGKVEVYRNFQTIFTARALFLSDEIKKSAVEWEAMSRLMTPEEKEKLMKTIANSYPGQLTFLLGFYTPDDDMNVLEQDGAPWITYLKYPFGNRNRASCFGYGQEEGKIFLRFLKWDLSWSKLYLVCYPDSEALHTPFSEGVKLIITGPGGTGEIDLKIIPPPD